MYIKWRLLLNGTAGVITANHYFHKMRLAPAPMMSGRVHTVRYRALDDLSVAHSDFGLSDDSKAIGSDLTDDRVFISL